jgi:hypothetical protein
MPYPPTARQEGRARRRPDFLCIGAQKAGTSWLAANLSTHPQVWSPYRKELHHFDTRHLAGDRLEKRRERTLRHVRVALKAAKASGAGPAELKPLRRLLDPERLFTDAWYEDVFAAAPLDMAAGEYTPRYSTLPDAGVEDVRRSCPEARIIWILRDPAERNLSGFRMHLARREIAPDDAAGVEREARAWLATDSPDRGDYADYLPRWEARWTAGETLLLLPFGRLKRDPRGFLAEVEALLGLDPFEDWPKLSDQVNRTPKAELPAWFVDEIRERAESHRLFVERRLGRDFAADLA